MLYNWQSRRVKDIPKFEAAFDTSVIPGPLFWEYPLSLGFTPHVFWKCASTLCAPCFLNMMSLESLCLMLDHALEDLQL
jgi:hypothetical protein